MARATVASCPSSSMLESCFRAPVPTSVTALAKPVSISSWMEEDASFVTISAMAFVFWFCMNVTFA